MANVLVNGFSAKSGGGKVIFDSYFKAVHSKPSCDLNYFFLTPDEQGSNTEFDYGHVIVDIPRFYRNKFALPLFYLYWLPKFCKKNSITIVLNFGDLILPFIKNQVYFFDWAYLCVPDSPIWSLMTRKEALKRKFKIFLIKFFFSNVSTVIVQSSSMRNRIQAFIHKIKCDVSCVELIQTPIDFLTYDSSLNVCEVPGKNKIDNSWNNLLFLAGYAPHKNFDIIVPLLNKIKNNDLNYRICVTLAHDQQFYKELRAKVEKEELEDYFVNLGQLDRNRVSLELSRCKALFLPTFLESYGIPYIEAMNANCSILTSDFDFVRAVCKESAFYFDPLDVDSIYDALILIETRPELVDEKKRIGRKISDSIIDWNEFSIKIETLLIDSAV